MNLFSKRSFKVKYIINIMIIKQISETINKNDLFDRVIRRFSETCDKKHDSDKITDYVMCMEALLVNSQSEVSYQFALYAALLNGGNEKMRKKNNVKLRKYYSIRSKMVHELDFSDNDKKMGPQNVTEIETFARIVILKMILISLEKKFEDLQYEQLVKKVEESLFDVELREKFDKMDSIIN